MFNAFTIGLLREVDFPFRGRRGFYREFNRRGCHWVTKAKSRATTTSMAGFEDGSKQIAI